MKKINIIFIGTGAIGVELLQALKRGFFDIKLVVTGVDKPAGRKLQLQPSAIKLAAEEAGIEVFQPLDIKAELNVTRLKNLNPDIILVMAYGQMLSQEILDIPKIACLNIHTSLLPKYRGASPIQTAVLNQDKKTGVSLMRMVRKMDAGPVYEQFELEIGADDTGQSLAEKLAKLAADEIPKALQAVVDGRIEAEDQIEGLVTHCGKISKSDGQIDWAQSTSAIMARIRAFTPWPGTYTFLDGKRLKIISAEAHEGSLTGEVGLVKRDGIVCQNGLIYPLELQLEGSKPQSFNDFINGHPDFIGSHLESKE